MIRYIALGLLIIVATSCNHVYYDTTESVEDKEKAKSTINGLKNGTLVIQLPCEKKKLEIFENKAKKETDPKKKARYINEFENYKRYLNFIQTSLMEAAHKEYKFSKYVFLPDSAVTDFKNGQRENILIDDSFEYVNDAKIEDSELVLFLRGQRYYDFLYIHNWDGGYPPDPFPRHTSLLSIISPPTSYDKINWLEILDWKRLFHKAFANLSFKLENYYVKSNAEI